MKYQEVLQKDDFKKCLEFHGHLCPGLAIGYKASLAGLEWLREKRAPDEELLAIVETDACAADAVQVLTGCTFGKGNFMFSDYGKNALTFVSRRSGRGVRVALAAGAFQPNERHMELIKKIREETATDEERLEFQVLHDQRSYEILEKDPAELFVMKSLELEVPAKARMEPSRPCTFCGEPTMGSKLEKKGEALVFRGCIEKGAGGFRGI